MNFLPVQKEHVQDGDAHKARPEVVYDLTEVLLASTGKLRYYGIARVVYEIGAALHRQDPTIRFAVFSAGHQELLEVIPTTEPDQSINMNVPVGIRQVRIRQTFHTDSKIRDLLLPSVTRLVNSRNRAAWDKAGYRLSPIDMTGKTLVSCGRPKLIVDMIDAMDRKGVTFDLVPLLHDMIPLHDFVHSRASFPRNFIGDNKVVIARSKALLTNSEFTRDEIIQFSHDGVLPQIPPVHAVPLAHECDEGEGKPSITPPKDPFFIAVGATLGRKNLEVIFDAMLKLHAQGKPVPTFVLAGARRKKTDDFLKSDQFDPIRDKIVFSENTEQCDLAELYRKAFALVIASRMEGWGLPAGEALWLGTPAICSDVPALREVCGDLGVYFDPDKADELAEILHRMMTEPQEASALRERIAQQHSDLRGWADVGADVNKALKAIYA